MRRLLLITWCSCGATGAPDAGPPDVFIAFASDFQPFRTWESHHLDVPADGTSEHPLGPFTVFLSHRPPSGATTFPVGTLIVKVLERNPPLVVGMAKRGGGYNDGGANGWEYFQLDEDAMGHVTLAWRGLGPPVGGSYGGDPLTCNACHDMAAANDFVISGDLQLSSF